MADIRGGMRELAEAAAGQARAPGAEAAVRRGRRRRRAHTAAAVLALVVLLAGAGWLSGPLRRVATPGVPAASPSAAMPAGPSTTRPAVASAARPGVAAGRVDGVGWTIQRLREDRGELCATFRVEVPGGQPDNICMPPAPAVTAGTGSGFDTRRGRLKAQWVAVDPQVARVRLWYDNPGRYSEFSDRPATTRPGTKVVHGRVEAATVGSGTRFPVRFAVLLVPADAGVTRLAAFDAQGRLRCDGDPWAPGYCPRLAPAAR
jgi:hypothetical protein